MQIDKVRLEPGDQVIILPSNKVGTVLKYNPITRKWTTEVNGEKRLYQRYKLQLWKRCHSFSARLSGYIK